MFIKLPGFKKADGPIISGDTFMADFTAAVTNLTTAATAQSMADQSEQDALNTINYVGAQQAGSSLALNAIAPELQRAIVRSSLDAHVQKAQSEKINSFAAEEMMRMEAEMKKNYIGKKVRISIVDKAFNPLESYWWNPNTGEFDKGNVKFGNVKGIIEDISLEKDLIVIKPSLGDKILMPKRKFIVAYVIKPDTLLPAINLSLN